MVPCAIQYAHECEKNFLHELSYGSQCTLIKIMIKPQLNYEIHPPNKLQKLILI
jgi:hypothetical protein